jgi:hypothetical protein
MKQRDFISAKAKEALLKDKDKYCGECCWFYGEDTYGYGFCPFRFADMHECGQKCDVPLKYVSKKEMRHHMAVLLQTNRYRRDQNVPSIYRMPNPTELGKAVDFAYKYIKTFSKL